MSKNEIAFFSKVKITIEFPFLFLKSFILGGSFTINL